MIADPFVVASRRWLLESGIRDRVGVGGGRPGGLFRAYHAAEGAYGPLYPEVTAYAVALHVRLWRATADRKDLEAAVESGEWLLEIQGRGGSPVAGGFPYAVEGGAPTGGWFTFDTAIIAHALLELGTATGEDAFAAAAERGVAWMLARQREDGSFGAGEAVRPVGWAGDGNCLHAKLAVVLGALWARSTASRCREAAERVLAWVSRLQQRDGGISTSSRARYVFVHAHCYAVEGLLAGAAHFGEEAWLRCAARGARFLAEHQRTDGGIPRYVGPDASLYLQEMRSRAPWLRRLWLPADVGATAQAVRIWRWVQAAEGSDFAEPVRRSEAWLRRHQIPSTDPRLDGGLPAGVDRLLGWERWERNLYPWVAVFAVDAVAPATVPAWDRGIF